MARHDVARVAHPRGNHRRCGGRHRPPTERHATCRVDPLDGSRTPRAPGPGHHLRVLGISRARRRLIYSTRSASDGSIREARRAGMRFATADTLSRIIAAPAHDTGSAAPIPYSAPATTRAAAIAARPPAARPT